MVGSAPSRRVGEAERVEAQRALQQHLDAGRLQVAEFVERFAVAAGAVTAAEIVELFADLPDPHPTLPGSPLGRTRRNLVVVGAVALLILGGVLGFVIGRGQTVPASSSSPVAAPTPTESTPAGPGAPVDSATARRSTGPGLIALRPSDGVDLDDLAGPTWNAGTGCCGRDVGFGPNARQLSIGGGHPW